MFAKLLKQEWKASFKLMSIMSLAALGASILEAVVLRMLVTAGDTAAGGLIWGTIGSLIVFLSLIIVAYAIGVQIVLVVRFYKNKFSDEGYLTFTLPVSCEQIFLSSLMNMVIWTVISVVVTVSCIAIIIAGGTYGLIDVRIWKYVREGILYTFQYNAELVGVTYWPLMVISTVVGLFSGPVVTMTAFTLGAVAAKKHPVLMSLVMAYLISIASSVVTVILTDLACAVVADTAGDTLSMTMQITYCIEVFLQIALMIGGYILSVWLMKRKLNLK